MPTPHSYYSYLLIYDGGAGEKPQSAAFYIPKFGDTLSGIAKSAYGMFTPVLTGVQRINRSMWNIQAAESGAFNYRQNSTSCKSKVVDPNKALTTQGYNDGGWLALCPTYPLIWIPETDGQMPEHLAPPDDPPAPPGMTLKIPASRGKPATSRTKPSAPKTRKAPGPGPTSPYYQGQGTGGGVKGGMSLASVGGGIPWWIWLLLAGAGVGAYAWSKRKKSKKRA